MTTPWTDWTLDGSELVKPVPGVTLRLHTPDGWVRLKRDGSPLVVREAGDNAANVMAQLGPLPGALPLVAYDRAFFLRLLRDNDAMLLARRVSGHGLTLELRQMWVAAAGKTRTPVLQQERLVGLGHGARRVGLRIVATCPLDRRRQMQEPLGRILGSAEVVSDE